MAEGVNVSAEAPVGRTTTPTLKENFFWTLAGRLVFSVTQWGILTILVRLGDATTVGQYTLALALSGPVFMLSNLQLSAVISTDAKRTYRFPDYLALRLLTSVLALCLIAVISLAAEEHWETRWLILSIGLSKLVESISDICYGLFQQHERMSRLSMSLVVRGIGGLMALAVTFWITESANWAVLAMTLSWVFALLGLDLPSSRRLVGPDTSLWPVWSISTLQTLLRISAPLGLVAFLDSLIANIPRYFVRFYGGEVAVGYFSAMAYIMVASGMLIQALLGSTQPRLAKYYNSNLRSFKLLIFKTLGVGFATGALGVVGAIAFGGPALSLVYGPEYAKFTNVFTWLMVSAGIWYMTSCVGSAITAARCFRVQVPLLAMTVVATVFGSYLWVPTYGILGAAWGLGLGMTVRLAGSMLILRSAIRARPLADDTIDARHRPARLP